MGREVRRPGKEAVDTFAELVKQCPDSPCVAESQLEVGKAAYADGKFQAAATAFAAAMEKAGKSDVGEEAAHRSVWADHRLDSTADAQQAFSYQRATWPKGTYAADAAFMDAECLFKQKKYSEALTAYQHVKDTSSKDFQVRRLHSAASPRYHRGSHAPPGARGPAKRNLAEDGGVRRSVDQRVSRVRATCPRPCTSAVGLQNLGHFDEALTEYLQVLAKSGEKKTEPAARAQFQIGEIQFQQKKYADAVASFYLALYQYPFPQWQADSAFEAAKCFENLHKRSQAVKQYQDLIKDFPQSDKVPAAKSRIETLQRRCLLPTPPSPISRL